MARVRSWRNRETREVTKKVTVRIEHDLKLSDMIDGLCSKYARNCVEGDDDPPSELAEKKIVEDIREEYSYWGTNAAWTWSDDHSDASRWREWAHGIIVAAFPEMESEQW